MTTTQAIFLGVVQGVTEFLPISSSGHLVIAQHFIKDFHQPGVLFDVLLHLGTLMAVFIYFRKEIGRLLGSLFFQREENYYRKLLLLLFLGNVPTGLIGISFRDSLERSFSSIFIVSLMLIVTGILLTLASFVRANYRQERDLNILDAFLIGTFQGLAIIPGISRSGSTIAAGLFRKLETETVVRFSFLLSVPAILGAVVLQTKGINQINPNEIWAYIWGTLVAMISGILSLHILIRLLRQMRLRLFSYYCFALGFFMVVNSW